MKNEISVTYTYPNRLGRIILLAMEEIIGKNGVNAVLNQAKLRNRINNYPKNTLDKNFRFEEISQIQTALEASYGLRGGRGLALRAGRACFKHILRDFGPEMNFTDLASRIDPLEDKVRMTTKVLAEVFNKVSDQRVTVTENENRFLWVISPCPFCWQREAEDAVCLMAVGLLQEALYWVSGGKFFHLEETNCIARGDEARAQFAAAGSRSVGRPSP